MEEFYMPKLNKDFFTDNEVIFVGYSSKKPQFSSGIYKAFVNNGIKVYPFNTNSKGAFSIKVYNSLDEMPKIPTCAYVLLNKDNTDKAVKLLAKNGVKRILFQNKKTVSPDTLKECAKQGIETAVACPMMILGSGIHKLHGFLAGVR